MTKNPHEDIVRADAALREVLESMRPFIGSLSNEQAEKLIFFLKAIHSYYPKSENSNVHWSEFDDTLRRIRESAEQKTLQSRTTTQILFGMLSCVVAGALLASALWNLTGPLAGIGTGISIVLAAGFVVVADLKFFKQAVSLAKEQDRRYFLGSLRAAKACNELDWAGLFAYGTSIKPGAQSDADIRRTVGEVADLAASLRNALYNDEYFQYTRVDGQAR